MAPERIKINQVYKAKSPKILIFADLDRLFHSMDGALGAERLRDSLAVKDIADLADGDHIVSVVL